MKEKKKENHKYSKVKSGFDRSSEDVISDTAKSIYIVATLIGSGLDQWKYVINVEVHCTDCPVIMKYKFSIFFLSFFKSGVGTDISVADKSYVMKIQLKCPNLFTPSHLPVQWVILESLLG